MATYFTPGFLFRDPWMSLPFEALEAVTLVLHSDMFVLLYNRELSAIEFQNR